jgi:hypothetical protein
MHIVNSIWWACPACFRFVVAAASEILLDRDVEPDKDGPRKPAHDRLQGKLDHEVEIRRKKRAAFVDHLAAVAFKGVSQIGELNVKQQSEKKIGRAVDHITRG